MRRRYGQLGAIRDPDVNDPDGTFKVVERKVSNNFAVLSDLCEEGES